MSPISIAVCCMYIQYTRIRDALNVFYRHILYYPFTYLLLCIKQVTTHHVHAPFVAIGQNVSLIL